MSELMHQIRMNRKYCSIGLYRLLETLRYETNGAEVYGYSWIYNNA